MSRISFLNQVNRPIESNFKAFQNLVSEHSVEGVPASLYNLTKSVPDPFSSGMHSSTKKRNFNLSIFPRAPSFLTLTQGDVMIQVQFHSLHRSFNVRWKMHDLKIKSRVHFSPKETLIFPFFHGPIGFRPWPRVMSWCKYNFKYNICSVSTEKE